MNPRKLLPFWFGFLALIAGPALAESADVLDGIPFPAPPGMAAARPEKQFNWLEWKVIELGRNPKYRHRIVAWMNKNGGKWARRLNDIKLRRDYKKTQVPHLHSVAPDLWRGGQPSPEGFRQLAKRGVKTVINLRAEDDRERGQCLLLGLKYVYLPIPDTGTPTPEQLQKYRQTLADPARGLTYVHCAAGTFRTSTMVAVYRMDQGWTFDQAYAEMRTFGFDPEMLDAPYEVEFLKDYAVNGPRPPLPMNPPETAE